MLLADVAMQPVPGWAWGAAIGIIACMAAIIGWFFKRELDRIGKDIAALHAEIQTSILPLRTEVKQVQSMLVGMDRRMTRAEDRLDEQRAHLREIDKKLLAMWAKVNAA